MANFVVQFSLKTEIFQEHILDKRFEIGRNMYNGLLNVVLKRYNMMINSKEYKTLISSLNGDVSHDKEIWSEVNKLHKLYRLTEYDFQSDIKDMQHYFKKNIDSFTAQKIASRVYKAFSKIMFGNGKKVHFKGYGEFNSLEGKSNKSGIRFIDDKIIWNGLSIPVKINYKNVYEYQAMGNEICYSRIIRKCIKGKNKYYVQIVFKGTPPVKANHTIGTGDVGLDIGVSTIAVSSDKDVKLLVLAEEVQHLENEKRLLLRKMDRSRRATNPDNYNFDGTIKKQGNKKVLWNTSNHYKRYKQKLKSIRRKEADIRRLCHEIMANYIISLGDNIIVEKMEFDKLQHKFESQELTDKGKFKSKKRFGKSLGDRAPSMLLSITDRKLSYVGKHLIEINTYKTKASQFNHIDGTYNKKSLSNRWNDIDGRKLQRDMYSAFLIMNINKDLETFDIDKINSRFERFIELHDKEVERLTGKKNLSCIAI